MTTRRKPRPGTVISGTMRPQDLIPALLAVAERHRVSRDQRKTLEHVRARLDSYPDYFDTEDAEWDLSELFTILETIAPANHYFGSHPGDGADFGFWPAEEI